MSIIDTDSARAWRIQLAHLRQGLLSPASALLGVTAYRAAFRRPRALLGRQPETIAGSVLWILPNPSGLNASFALDQFHALRGFLDSLGPGGEGMARPP